VMKSVMLENAFPAPTMLEEPSKIHTMSMRGGNAHVGDWVGAPAVGDVGASEGRTVGVSVIGGGVGAVGACDGAELVGDCEGAELEGDVVGESEGAFEVGETVTGRSNTS
jgi:hypothetical protein